MTTELRVPAARHHELGVVVAAELETDDELRLRLSDLETRAGLRCASCDAPVQFVNATMRARHFRHVADAACVWGPESSWHLAIKDAFVRAFEYWRDELADGWELEVTAELPRLERRLWQADVACVATHATGATRKMMVEVQQSPQAIEDTKARTAVRQSDGWDVLWVHYNPSDPLAPRWLRDAAPSIGLDVTPYGHVQVASGYLERRTWRQSEVPTMDPPLPGEEDVVVIDEWDTDPRPLTIFLRRWLTSSGLLTDPIDGRRGLAWATPPEHSPLESDVPVLVDTYEVYTWLQQRAADERQSAVLRQLSDVTAARRNAEERAARTVEAIRPLLNLLQVHRRQAAKYAAPCFCCGTRVHAGDPAALMKNELTAGTWRLICDKCSAALSIR